MPVRGQALVLEQVLEQVLERGQALVLERVPVLARVPVPVPVPVPVLERGQALELGPVPARVLVLEPVHLHLRGQGRVQGLGLPHLWQRQRVLELPRQREPPRRPSSSPRAGRQRLDPPQLRRWSLSPRP